jgi:hypothetical protein
MTDLPYFQQINRPGGDWHRQSNAVCCLVVLLLAAYQRTCAAIRSDDPRDAASFMSSERIRLKHRSSQMLTPHGGAYPGAER